MRIKLYSILLTGLISGILAFGQTMRPVSKTQLGVRADYQSKLGNIYTPEEKQLTEANDIIPMGTATPRPAGKTAGAVSPIKLGRASNIYSVIRGESNQIWANDQINSISFIHRHDITVFGGSVDDNGRLRYDCSTDGGDTWINDIGTVNPDYSLRSRYPNITGRVPSGSANPFDATLLYAGATLSPATGWDGYVTGMLGMHESVPDTEKYIFLSSNTLIPSGLTQSDDTTFWMVDFAYNDPDVLDTIYVYKGTMTMDTAASPTDIVWVRVGSIAIDNYDGYDGSTVMLGPNIAFSPDGQVGYVAWIGDMVGGQDTNLSPCYMQTLDGGATWGTPVELNLALDTGLSASIAYCWTYDTLGTETILGSGRATCGFDYDITVDSAGGLHFFTIVGNSTYSLDLAGTPDDDREPLYSMYTSLEMYAVDFVVDKIPDSPNGYISNKISPVLTFRWDTDPEVTMDNYPQISRSEDGKKVFYSWTDSDGIYHDCADGGAGNLFPDLRLAGWDISTGNRTDVVKLTDGDALFGGAILFPAMAPTVLSDAGTYNLPIVFSQILVDGLNPVQFWYVGNDAEITDTDFVDPSTLHLVYGEEPFCSKLNTVGEDLLDEGDIGVYPIFPNPTDGNLNLHFECAKTAEIEITLADLRGQQLLQIAQSKFSEGKHKLEIKTTNLPQGMYLLNLQAGSVRKTERVMILN